MENLAVSSDLEFIILSESSVNQSLIWGIFSHWNWKIGWK